MTKRLQQAVVDQSLELERLKAENQVYRDQLGITEREKAQREEIAHLDKERRAEAKELETAIQGLRAKGLDLGKRVDTFATTLNEAVMRLKSLAAVQAQSDEEIDIFLNECSTTLLAGAHLGDLVDVAGAAGEFSHAITRFLLASDSGLPPRIGLAFGLASRQNVFVISQAVRNRFGGLGTPQPKAPFVPPKPQPKAKRSQAGLVKAPAKRSAHPAERQLAALERAHGIEPGR